MNCSRTGADAEETAGVTEEPEIAAMEAGETRAVVLVNSSIVAGIDAERVSNQE